MKIGIDARLWSETGVGRYIRSLVFNLKTIDSRNQYVLFMLKKDISQIEVPDTWEKVVTEVSWHSLEEQFKLPAIFKSAQLDLLHIPYFSVPLFNSVPFIVTVHDLILSHHATGKATTQPAVIYLLKRLGYKFVLNEALKRAGHIICVSETVKKQLAAEYNVNPGRISVTYEAGDLEKSERIIKSQANPPQITNYLLYVGNAHPHKNLENLILAFEILSKTNSHLRLVMIGKNDYFYQRLKKIIEDIGLKENIILPGMVTNYELEQWYKNALCFVFPSLEEGFGIPGLEAMNSGCPVAASNIDVFHEIYQSAAIYFNQLDPKDISSKLLKLIENQDIKKSLIKKGKIKAKEYSWQKMSLETLRIYENSYRLRSPQ